MAWIIDDAASKIKSKSFMSRRVVKYSDVEEIPLGEELYTEELEKDAS